MICIRRPFVAALAAMAALAVATPVASASVFPTATLPFSADPSAIGGNTSLAGPCGSSRPTAGQGDTGHVANQVCQGAGLSFIGPSIGQISTVVGPTIIGPAVIGNLITSSGDAAGG
jgi:hypothetical protein